MHCGGVADSFCIATCARCVELQRYKNEVIHLRDMLNEANIRIKHYKQLLGEKTDSEPESGSESGSE